MARIGIHTDETGFPNLAAMKLSAHHKALGDDVGLFNAIERGTYDTIYSSKVFTFTPTDPYLPESAVCGGKGYGLKNTLPDNIEHAMPDYSLYRLDYSLGFLTRGCPRNCDWCSVPATEGGIHPHADIEEFAAHRDVVLMDNNVLACDHGIQQIEKIARLGLRADFNQGLDCRLIDDSVARLLSKVNWLKPVRLACDFKGQIPSIRRAVELLRWHNVTPRRYFVYTLIRDVDDALERIRALKGMELDPFAQPEIPHDAPPDFTPTKAQSALARWVNHKAEFKSRCWEDYAAAHGVAP